MNNLPRNNYYFNGIEYESRVGEVYNNFKKALLCHSCSLWTRKPFICLLAAESENETLNLEILRIYNLLSVKQNIMTIFSLLLMEN